MNTAEALKIIKDRLQGKALKGQRRSSKWRKIRERHIELNGECEVCGRKDKLEVHHILPFSLFPDLELAPDNLITLCENKKNGVNCHLFFGHLGNYRKYNPSCKGDVLMWRAKLGRLDLNNDL